MKKIINGLITIVLLLLLFLRIYGFQMAIVLTGSMSGTIEPNDVIIVKEKEAYAVGEIVMYQTEGIPVTHRIIQVTDQGYVTKGDANQAADGIISKERIIGKVVWVIPKIGAGIAFLQTPLGGLCMVILLGIMMVIPACKKNGTKC